MRGSGQRHAYGKIASAQCDVLPIQVLDLPENNAIKSQLADLVSQVQRHKAAGGDHGGSSGNGTGGGVLGSISSLVGGERKDGSGSNGDGSGHGSHQRSPAELLAECRKLAMQVAVPRNVRDDLEKAMREAGAFAPLCYRGPAPVRWCCTTPREGNGTCVAAETPGRAARGREAGGRASRTTTRVLCRQPAPVS